MKQLPARVLISLCLIIFLSACRNPAGTPSEEISLDKILLELPDAVNNPQGGGQTGTPQDGPPAKAVTELDMLQAIRDIYSPVRDAFNPLASLAIDYTAVLLQEMDHYIFQNEELMTRLYSGGSVAWTSDDTLQKIKITWDNNTYRVESWMLLEDLWLKLLDVRFAKDAERYAGTIFTRPPQANPEHRPEYRIDFDTADPVSGQQTMELRIINLDFDDPAIDNATENRNIPEKLWLSARQDNETFCSAANISFTAFELVPETAFSAYFMSLLNNSEPYIPGATTVNAHYLYRCAVDLIEDRGAVDLALVPEAVQEVDTVFTNYSVGLLYKEAVAEWIRKGTADGTALIEIMNHLLSQAGSDLQVTESSSTDQIFEALVVLQEYAAEQGQSTEFFDTVLFIVKLVNPGYFDAQSGFVGNEEISRPLWASAVPPFGSLDVLSAAEVSGPQFTVVMPDDGPPDF